MTLTELKYIVSLAQEKHFGRAAAACQVSQPTLSVAIRKLEDRLGVAIFERNKQGVTVTPVGEQIVTQANRVLEESLRIEDIAASGKNQLSSPLKLGVIFTIGPYLLPHIIPQLRTHAPDMALVIDENFTGNLRKRLRDGQIDVAILALPFVETDILTKPLYDEPFDILLPAVHPLAELSAIPAEALTNEPLLLLGEGHCFRDQILDACPNIAMATREPNGHIQTMADGTSLETLRHMVASNLGITILPRSATGSHLYNENLVKVRPFAGVSPTRTVALAWRTSFPRPSAIDAIESAIRLCKMH
ncbi:hydrogen peroxide-inducible genes activator [Reinekea blandensis]|uniref:Probable transcriptional regulator n=1 Tax=Reinekea blandensis MED297 TaxID=314283 RepID=A4BIV7_9GAMM|nr:hydrogen peroxide-inducible genes activator [Reinekea blandensis]EAR07974.1 probable transcriptional regulator [Reinekea sp. MED297] [Reinekea blandensis MED297]